MKAVVRVESYVEVDLSAEDFISALRKLPDGDHLPTMLQAINESYAVLKRIPDETIADMNERQRKLTAEALRAQADRYMPIYVRDEASIV